MPTLAGKRQQPERCHKVHGQGNPLPRCLGTFVHTLNPPFLTMLAGLSPRLQRDCTSDSYPAPARLASQRQGPQGSRPYIVPLEQWRSMSRPLRITLHSTDHSSPSSRTTSSMMDQILRPTCLKVSSICQCRFRSPSEPTP